MLFKKSLGGWHLATCSRGPKMTMWLTWDELQQIAPLNISWNSFSKATELFEHWLAPWCIFKKLTQRPIEMEHRQLHWPLERMGSGQLRPRDVDPAVELQDTVRYLNILLKSSNRISSSHTFLSDSEHILFIVHASYLLDRFCCARGQ